MKHILKSLIKTTFVFVGLLCSVLNTYAQSDGSVVQKKNKSEKDFSFAFITDIHISDRLDNLPTKQLPLPRKEITDVPFLGFEKALKEIKEFNVDFVLTGGDNIGTESYLYPNKEGDVLVSVPYEKMKKSTQRMHEISSKIDLPVYYANGNHDVYFFPPVTPKDAHYGSKFFAENLGLDGKDYYSFDKKGWHFIVLNTFDGNENKFGISDKQLDWLQKDLNKVDKSTPVVISGHAPLSLREKYEEKSNAVYQIIKNHNIKLMLFGHFHSYYEYTWHNIPCVVGSSLSGNVWTMKESVRSVDINGDKKDIHQGYMIVSIVDGKINWKHYPFTYNFEKYYYNKTGKRPKIKYN